MPHAERRRIHSVRRVAVTAMLVVVASCAVSAPVANTSAPLAAQAIDFPSVPVVPLGGTPSAIATADLNGDGRPDLIAAMGAAGVTVSLGRAGGFAPPSTVLTGAVSVLVTGDFDRDSAIDVAVLDGDGVSVLCGRGDGSFDAPSRVAVGRAPSAIVCADLDRDGALDLAVADLGGSIHVLRGKGDGTFMPAEPYAALPVGGTLVARDVDGDGKLDLLLISTDRRVAPLLGNGDGTFRAAPLRNLGGESRALTLGAGDLDGDGKLDIVYADRGKYGSVGVGLGNGDGTFRMTYLIEDEHLFATGLAVGDLDGDGRLDVIAEIERGRVVLTALGKDDGTFGPLWFYGPAGHLLPAALDVDGDGRADVLATTASGVAVSTSGAGGLLRAPRNFPVRWHVRRLAIADFNGDGVPDLVASSGGEYDGVFLLLGDGRGGFGAARQIRRGDIWTSTQIGVGDLNGDGKPDLVLPGDGIVMIGNGAGGFHETHRNPRQSRRSVAFGDFDGDGKVDLLLYGGTQVGSIALLLLGKGDGTFQPERPVPFDNGGALAAADLDGDGRVDLAVATGEGPAVRFGQADGTFTPARPIGDKLAGTAIVAADLDGDGHQDLVVAHAGEATSDVLLGMGNGTFRSAGAVSASGGLHVADMDGDGVLDLVVESGGITVFRGHGDGTFELAETFPISGADPGLADLDGDGLPEIVTVPGHLRYVTVFHNATLRAPSAHSSR
jgi:hypothetical protein